MLVLSRKKQEKLLIGENIWITIVDIGRGQVKIAIDAPSDVKVLREELISKLENQES